MAAPVPPGVPPAPPAPPVLLARAPAPPIPTLGALFSDAARDPGGHPDTMRAFFCNPANGGVDMRSDALRDQVAASGGEHQVRAYMVASGGKARIYSLPVRWLRGLGAAVSPCDNRLYAIEGELYGRAGGATVVELPGALFNRQAPQTIVPEPATIVTELAADPTIEEMGPYAAGDDHTVGVKYRRISPSPTPSPP